MRLDLVHLCFLTATDMATKMAPVQIMTNSSQSMVLILSSVHVCVFVCFFF